MKCKICGKGNVVRGKCNECDALNVDGVSIQSTRSQFGSCERCGKEGRNVHTDKDEKRPPRYLCFDCKEKEIFERSFATPKEWIEQLNWYKQNKTEEELYLICARKEYVEKPIYEGRKPDYARIRWYECKVCQAEAAESAKAGFEPELKRLSQLISKSTSAPAPYGGK